MGATRKPTGATRRPQSYRRMQAARRSLINAAAPKWREMVAWRIGSGLERRAFASRRANDTSFARHPSGCNGGHFGRNCICNYSIVNRRATHHSQVAHTARFGSRRRFSTLMTTPSGSRARFKTELGSEVIPRQCVLTCYLHDTVGNRCKGATSSKKNLPQDKTAHIDNTEGKILLDETNTRAISSSAQKLKPDQVWHHLQNNMTGSTKTEHVKACGHLLEKLLPEGKESKAHRLASGEKMKSLGADTSSRRFREMFKRTDDARARQISHDLQLMYKKGNYVGMRRFFASLVRQRVANTTHFNILLKSYGSSRKMQKAIRVDMKKVGLEPDLFTYLTLWRTMLKEGDLIESWRLVENKIAPMKANPSKDNEDVSLVRLKSKIRNEASKRLSDFYKSDDVLAMQKLHFVLVKSGIANANHFNLMLKVCRSSKEMRHILGVDMKRSRVPRSLATYHTLIERLLMEGNIAGAHSVVASLVHDGLKPTTSTRNLLARSNKKLSLARLNLLRMFTRHKDTAAARDFFYLMVRQNIAAVEHFTFFLQACQDSEKMRKIIYEDMKTAAVQPDLIIFHIFLKQLMLEGDFSSIRDVVADRIPDAGLDTTQDTWAILEVEDSDLSRMRTNRLNMLFNESRLNEMKTFFDKLVERKLADVYHYTVMMKTFRDSDQIRDLIDSDQIRDLIENDTKASDPGEKLRPMYASLCSQLMFEGDVNGARSVVEKDLLIAGIEPDKHIAAALEKPPDVLGRMRTSYLKDLVKTGRHVLAQSFFDKLVRNGAAVPYQLNVTLKACMSSDKMLELIHNDGVRAVVKPNMYSWCILAEQLLLEGDRIGAKSMLENNINAKNIKSLKFPIDLNEKSEDELKLMRARRMMALSSQQNLIGMRLFLDTLINNGVAAEQHFIPIMKECQTSKEIREIIRVDMVEHAGISPGSATYFWLVSKLVEEGDTYNLNQILNKEMPEAGLKLELWMRSLAHHVKKISYEEA